MIIRKAIILLDEINRTEGNVINIIECDERGLQGLEVPENQIIWDCSQFNVFLGDKWINGIFYRENEPVEVLLTNEEIEINKLKENVVLVENAIISLMDKGV